jgi:flagellar protein FlgJ
MPAPVTQAGLAAAPERLRRAAQDFEAQALSQLLQPAFMATDTSRSAFGGGAAEAQWRPMLLDAMAGAAARSGHGVGIAGMVLREMLRWQSAGTNQENPR